VDATPNPKLRLRRLADEQGGQFTPLEASACGVSKDQLHRMAKSGEVERLLYGAYRFAGLIMDEWAWGRAALNSFGEGAALSHEWAAAAHGQPGYAFPSRPIVSLVRRARPRAGTDLRRVDVLDPVDVTTVRDLRVTTGARTVLDLAGPLGEAGRHGAVLTLVDNAITRRLTSAGQLHRRATALDDGSPAPGWVRDVTQPGAAKIFQSWLERTAAAEMERRRLPLPRWQVPVYDDDGYIGTVDGLYEDTPVIIEWEGLRFHMSPAQRRKDAARFTRLVTARYLPLRFNWFDVVERFDFVERQIRKSLRLA
jgi:hypothetical protein